MTERRWRILTALVAIAAALVLIHSVERHRAARSPSGWVSAPVVETGPVTPRIGTSRWILGPGVVWRSEERAEQWYLRAELSAQARLTVRHGEAGPGIQLDAGAEPQPVGSETHTCEGSLPVVGPQAYPLVFERTQDGYVFHSGEDRIACSADLQPASPVLQSAGAPVALVSIGIEEWPAGVPVSGNGWLGGLALVGFLWMLLLELERFRGVAWPVVIATGVPCVPAVALLWLDPGLKVAGISGSLALVGLTLGLKLTTIVVGGKALPQGEE